MDRSWGAANMVDFDLSAAITLCKSMFRGPFFNGALIEHQGFVARLIGASVEV